MTIVRLLYYFASIHPFHLNFVLNIFQYLTIETSDQKIYEMTRATFSDIIAQFDNLISN